LLSSRKEACLLHVGIDSKGVRVNEDPPKAD